MSQTGISDWNLFIPRPRIAVLMKNSTKKKLEAIFMVVIMVLVCVVVAAAWLADNLF